MVPMRYQDLELAVRKELVTVFRESEAERGEIRVRYRHDARLRTYCFWYRGQGAYCKPTIRTDGNQKPNSVPKMKAPSAGSIGSQ